MRPRAKGKPRAVDADGRAGRRGARRPTDPRPPADRPARSDRPPNACRPTACRPTREDRVGDVRIRSSLVARSFLARSSLAARCARRGAERSGSPAGAPRGEAPHTPAALMGDRWWVRKDPPRYMALMAALGGSADGGLQTLTDYLVLLICIFWE